MTLAKFLPPIAKPPRPAAFDLIVDGGDAAAIHTDCGDRQKIDLANRGMATRVRGTAGTVTFADLRARMKRCEIWLPADAIVEPRALRIDAGAHIEPPHAPALRRWVHHGSSRSAIDGGVEPHPDVARGSSGSRARASTAHGIFLDRCSRRR
jgi:hypothetical protein